MGIDALSKNNLKSFCTNWHNPYSPTTYCIWRSTLISLYANLLNKLSFMFCNFKNLQFCRKRKALIIFAIKPSSIILSSCYNSFLCQQLNFFLQPPNANCNKNLIGILCTSWGGKLYYNSLHNNYKQSVENWMLRACSQSIEVKDFSK